MLGTEFLDRQIAVEIVRHAAATSQKQPVQPEELRLRSYQKELAEKAMSRKNCLIVAPTGCGKTHVALAIAKVCW